VYTAFNGIDLALRSVTCHTEGISVNLLTTRHG